MAAVKILLCHNYYRYRGGEDVSFEADIEMLRSFGHELHIYTKHNTEINGSGRLRLAKNTIWSRDSETEISDIIATFQPQVMHCNNIFPQISPSVYRAANRRGVAVVQALRNYRLLCANSYLFRDGHLCTQCVDRPLPYPALLYGCYRDSRLATAAVVGMQVVHNALGTWKQRVDAYFTPSAFARSLFIRNGIDGNRIAVRTNFVHPDLGLASGSGGYALFVGRLSPEKGLRVLLKAWQTLHGTIPLKIVGTGPDEEPLRSEYGNLAGVEWLGSRSSAEVLELLADAKCLVMPSEWYETFGRTIAEALSRGTPVIASRLGAMAELVIDGKTGFLFEPSNAEALVTAVRMLVADDSRYQTMRREAYDSYKARFTREKSYEQLMRVYNEAIANRKPASK
jgi:glycosyltransferase involved in cell wall biosynthesis